jgi:hypothetical protein
METTRKRFLHALVGCTLAHLLIGASPIVAQSDCKLVLDASFKTFSTPTHAYATMNIGGKDQITETIFTPTAIYVRFDGKWSASALTPKDMAELQQKNRQNSKATCSYLKDEAVNGVMAAVYMTHDQTPKGTIDSRIWISKTKGLPLRQETDIDVGGGNKSHSSSRYEYDNVKAPM